MDYRHIRDNFRLLLPAKYHLQLQVFHNLLLQGRDRNPHHLRSLYYIRIVYDMMTLIVRTYQDDQAWIWNTRDRYGKAIG